MADHSDTFTAERLGLKRGSTMCSKSELPDTKPRNQTSFPPPGQCQHVVDLAPGGASGIPSWQEDPKKRRKKRAEAQKPTSSINFINQLTHPPSLSDPLLQLLQNLTPCRRNGSACVDLPPPSLPACAPAPSHPCRDVHFQLGQLPCACLPHPLFLPHIFPHLMPPESLP